MQGIGSFVESSPHWKQSKFIQTLLPYAPLATEYTKETASKALSHMKSEGSNQSSDSSRQSSSEQDDSSSHSTNNPFY